MQARTSARAIAQLARLSWITMVGGWWLLAQEVRKRSCYPRILKAKCGSYTQFQLVGVQTRHYNLDGLTGSTRDPWIHWEGCMVLLVAVMRSQRFRMRITGSTFSFVARTIMLHMRTFLQAQGPPGHFQRIFSQSWSTQQRSRRTTRLTRCTRSVSMAHR